LRLSSGPPGRDGFGWRFDGLMEVCYVPRVAEFISLMAYAGGPFRKLALAWGRLRIILRVFPASGICRQGPVGLGIGPLCTPVIWKFLPQSSAMLGVLDEFSSSRDMPAFFAAIVSAPPPSVPFVWRMVSVSCIFRACIVERCCSTRTQAPPLSEDGYPVPPARPLLPEREGVWGLFAHWP